MLDQNAILDAHDVRRNPVHWQAEARKAPMNDRKIFFGYNLSRLVFQSRRHAFDELEYAVATWFDVSAVLNVVGLPVALSRCIVPLVEQCVEGLKDKLFILLFNRLIHFILRPKWLCHARESYWAVLPPSTR